MPRHRWAVLTLLTVVPILALAQSPTTNFKVRAALVDKDLNAKPIPKLQISLRDLSSPSSAEAIRFTTSFEGTAEVPLPAGRYELSTPSPIEFQGKKYSWQLNVEVAQPEYLIELSNDNAKAEEVGQRRLTDELTVLFKNLQNGVVTVWSEIGHGTGFVVDEKGLILTNQHVVGPSEYIAVQFDEQRKLPAVLLAADPQKDIAVLWTNLAAVPDTVVAKLITPQITHPTVVEGERVFTIGSPLSQRKILTTGTASKVEAKAILSDININPGNSGGPLFNSLGDVVGITTFHDPGTGSPGISGIVRIEQVFPLLEQARSKMSTSPTPVKQLLPVEPEDAFPLEAIKTVLQQKKFDTKPYTFEMGSFDVAVITPPLYYYHAEGAAVRGAKEKEKRVKKGKGYIEGTFKPLDELHEWATYVGEYKPLIFIRATPKLRETTGSSLIRTLVTPYAQAKFRYKTDFYRMQLFCGKKEVQPILPGKIAHVIDVNNRFINATDATYEGLYSYPYDAIKDTCGPVTLQISSEKKPNKPEVKALEIKTINKVVADFAPYRLQLAAKVNASPYLNQHKPSGQNRPATPEVKAIKANITTTDQHHADTTVVAAQKVSPVQSKRTADTSLEGRAATLSSTGEKTTTMPASNAGAAVTEAPAIGVDGTLSVTSTPDGAEIFIDSVGRGRTPSLLKVAPGEHSVQLVLAGHQDWVSKVEVKARSIVNVTATIEK